MDYYVILATEVCIQKNSDPNDLFNKNQVNNMHGELYFLDIMNNQTLYKCKCKTKISKYHEEEDLPELYIILTFLLFKSQFLNRK